MNFTRKLTVAALSLSMLLSAGSTFANPADASDKKAESSSWMPGKKTLAALTIGLGSIAAYKYSDTFAGYADAGYAYGKDSLKAGCNWADDLSGNRVSVLMAYGSDKLGAGANWMMDTRAVKTAVSAKDSVVGFAKDRYSKFSWPTMAQFKGLFSWGAKAAETVVEETAEAVEKTA